MFKKNKSEKKQISVRNVFVFYPVNFDDVQYCIDALANDTPLIASFTKADAKNTQRFLDFLSGAIYAMKGRVLQLDKRDFLFVPKGVEVLFDN